MANYLRGIDVSNHQGNIDWKRVSQTDVKFAFVKATEGGTYQDKFYERNVNGANEHGIAVGAYHFFRPKGPVEKQIENFLKVSGAASTTLPPVVDLEVPNDWHQFILAERIKMIQIFLNAIEIEFKCRPIIYMNSSFAKGVLMDSDAFKTYDLWIAHYTSSPSPALAHAWNDWTIWQYSDAGTVSGITGAVDLNFLNDSRASLKR